MLIKQDKCFGCGVCALKCPQNAITMLQNMEGFFYPIVDINKCNECKICEKICPVINSDKIQIMHHNAKCYAGYLQNDDLLRKSSSGGVATALAQAIISRGGIVYGVAYAKDFRSAEFIVCTTERDIEKIRGTKYIQSRKNEIYRNIEKQCIQGKKVLVIGLPCEIAAVRIFLGKRYDNLYMCELICHGPTSEKVQKHFVDKLERKFKSKIVEYNVRYKKKGWIPLYVRAKFANGRIYERRLDQTDFFHALAIFIRPSCYRCEFKGDRRVADISIGDFWGDIEKEEFYNKNGVSAIMIHTKKGEELFNMIREMVVYPVRYNMIQAANPRLDICEQEDKKRKQFARIFTNKKLSLACIMTRGLKKSIGNILWDFHE